MGRVYKVTFAGDYFEVASFDGANGAAPKAGLTLGSDGAFYGTTSEGGANNKGTVFCLGLDGTLTTLHSFAGRDGQTPIGGVIEGSDGAFYGTTTSDSVTGRGTIYRVTTGGALTTLHVFGRTPLSSARAGLLTDGAMEFGSDAGMIGVTASGGALGFGSVFRMGLGGTAVTLAEVGGANGSEPNGPPVRGPDGALYGTARSGGAAGFGTVWRMSPQGTITTLVSFGGGNGATPSAGLVPGGDGNFYGATEAGGASGAGAVFRVSPAGVFAVLASFGGAPGLDGNAPIGALAAGGDGALYGVTRAGGANGFGTVYRITAAGAVETVVSLPDAAPVGGLALGLDGKLYGLSTAGLYRVSTAGGVESVAAIAGARGGLTRDAAGNFLGAAAARLFKATTAGVVTTLADYTSDPDGAQPLGEPAFGPDGNLYAVTSETLVRLIFPGPPVVENNGAPAIGSTTASLAGRINARGMIATAQYQYGTDGVTFPLTRTVLSSPFSGYLTSAANADLTSLASGTTYHVRLRATNASGTSTSGVRTFTTLAPPTVQATGATAIGPTSATLNGFVNGHGKPASVFIEYGTDGVNFPNNVVPTPASTSGTGNTLVTAAVSPLTPGQTYFYRLVASSEVGTTAGAPASFTALQPPTATVGAAFALNTTSARVNGSVRVRNSTATVFFDYGTDGVTFPNTVAALPALVSGDLDTPVTANLSNLAQGVTYSYRVRAVSDGGTGLSLVGQLNVAVLSGFMQVAPGLPLAAQGFVLVNLTPAGIGAAWRFVGEQQWRPSGVPLGGLTTGNREIEFRPVPGWLHPLREPVSIVSGQPLTVVGREYFPSDGATTGSLGMTLLPVSLGAAAQWRLLGEDDAAWRVNNATQAGLAAGVYLVECKPVGGYATPLPVSVAVGSGAARTATATYFLADAPVGTQPAVVGYDAIASATPNAFTYVGQLRSDSGAGTGFVVRRRVVATAAHVVFDDGTLSAATGLQWLFQRDRGTYEPVPQIPRGSYIMSGYSTRRAVDASPGQSSAAAQNLDVAAVWFFEEDAGRGGSGGYLASDSADNEWLISSRLKTLVGYPLDGIAPQNQGRMHATPAMSVTFAHANDRVYFTSDITSRGGNSGGPLCVQYDDGKYFPAAIYLGGTTQTRVRVIDSGAITLFDSAEESGNSGQNSTNGGVPQVNNSAAATTPGALTVTLEPADARTAGAGWRIGTGAFHGSGQSLPFLSPGNYTVTFASIPKFKTPAARSVHVAAGANTPLPVSYVGLQPPVITGAAALHAVRGQSCNLTLFVANSPTQVSATGVDAAGLAFNAAARRISGVPEVNGTFPVVVTARNEVGASAPFRLLIIVSDPGQLTVTYDGTRGSVTSPGTVLTQGQGVTLPQGRKMVLTAKAKAPGFIFAGWQVTGATPGNVNTPSIEFEMTANVAATATFVPNPFLTFGDTYAGRIGPASGLTLSNTGSLSLKVTNLGRITGKLLLGAKSFTVNGQFRPDGTAAAIVIKRNGLGDLILDLALDLTVGGSERIIGTLTDGATVLPVALDRAVFDTKLNPAPQSALDPKTGKPVAAAYTVVLQRDPTRSADEYPGGHGFGVATVKPDGTVRFTGTLGDGSALTQTGVISKTGTWPFHVLLYKNGGVLTGDLAFRTVAGVSDLDGTLDWIKPVLGSPTATYPGGFAGRTSVLGARYDKTQVFPAGRVQVGEGRVGTVPDAVFTVDASGKITITPSTWSLKFVATSGLFSGSFPDPVTSKARKFGGAYLQTNGKGYGNFTGNSLPAPASGLSSGFVEVVP